ncbi:MAG: orotidine-5'-phosphate decarboxylase [Candidatus Kaiserbacteria bacterium]|nr:orotidine-5'-phosphate decarboxylase [Candidatus Kaiserbacteria bacterium]
MASRNFRELLESRWELGNFLCVGLDSELSRIPESARKGTIRETLFNFNRGIIDATHRFVCAFKPNSAFYEAHGEEGLLALSDTVNYIHEVAPNVPFILDAKRADIGNTNNGYVEAIFDRLGVDAVTLHPYLGKEALMPFLKRSEKGIIILCKTSNPGAGEFQDLETGGKPLYLTVAEHVAKEWNANGNCGLVVGATYPEDLKKVRAIAGDMPMLIPGIGEQGGDLEKTVSAGRDSRGRGMIISASRSVIFASSGKDYAEEARKKATELDGVIRSAL